VSLADAEITGELRDGTAVERTSADSIRHYAC